MKNYVVKKFNRENDQKICFLSHLPKLLEKLLMMKQEESLKF